MPNILITGISGFVGKETATELLKKPENKITGLIRPQTDTSRIAAFQNLVNFVHIDLCDIHSLKTFLDTSNFDAVIHIGALRGGRPDSKDKYYLANVEATSVIAHYCLKNNAKLIYCSSVGVFGAIPSELPANENTPRKNDNYYHFTKIRSEEIINELYQKGLKAIIIRPAITYGKGDFGFPYTLCKLVDKKLMLLPHKDVYIHLTNVHELAKAFAHSLDPDIPNASKFIIADKNPVKLSELVDLISLNIHNKAYPKSRVIPSIFFKLATNIAKFFKSEIFISRFELISQSWFYDVENSYNILSIDAKDSLKCFTEVVDWYKEGK